MIDKSRSRPIKFVVSVILFAYLTYFISVEAVGIDLLDAAVTSLVQISDRSFFKVFYTVVAWVASPGKDVLWLLIMAFLLYGFKYKIQAGWAVMYMASTMLLGVFFKHLVARVRPIGHLAQDTGYSYPSGHVLGTAVLVMVIILFVVPDWPSYRWSQVLRWGSIVWLVLVIFSRIYLGAHYPTDTLGALLLAWAWAQVMEWAYVRWAEKCLRYRVFYRSYL
ncbi:phosphatase PAP2 family protein [Lactiplantibacillus modestisalitolerans]|uniref:Phosphatase PAP2 family protein n=1 Tax=Lactiplantibacillus modestisalitolerans TaxID=1457219 RepID=A0ABV5WUU7_9LACO|nr:phosphatase PAP2 family protein [Lactiplantibacillus modestisalitolerans]